MPNSWRLPRFIKLPHLSLAILFQSWKQTHLGKCLSTTSMQQPRILRLLSLVGTVAMVQYLFNLWNLKLILTRTLISSLVQTPMSESYYSRSRSRCPASCPRVIAWFSCMVTLRFGSRSFVVASTVDAIRRKFHSFLLCFCQRLTRTRSRYVLASGEFMVDLASKLSGRPFCKESMETCESKSTESSGWREIKPRRGGNNAFWF